MKTSTLGKIAPPGVTLLGVLAWAFRTKHATAGKTGHPAHLFCGADEYWNGDYPEEDPQW